MLIFRFLRHPSIRDRSPWMTTMWQPWEQVLDKARGHRAQRRLPWRKRSGQATDVLSCVRSFTAAAETGVEHGEAQN